jgi:PAS domain S-box-containing protein
MRTPEDTAGHGDAYGLAELMLDSVPIGVIFCDTNCVVRFINKTYAGYIGIDRREAIGKKITDLIPTSRAATVMSSAVAELRGTCRIRREDGSFTNLIVNRVPVRGGSGQIVGFISQSIIADTDEMKELVEKITLLNKEVAFYRKRVESALCALYSIHNIIGESAAIRKVKEHLSLYAITESSLLIVGETGTGKELFASALHLESQRAEGPFVCINCAAVPHELFESELFGYVGGSFSGARKEGKVGHIELADHGTLFLDEIGEMPLQIQAKLLRVLEDKNVFRIGSSKPHKVDFRLVAATNRDLKSAIMQGKFREDLYYRISSLILTIPPLREREGDIPILVKHFLSKLDRNDTYLSGCAMDALNRYTWPGNIRELRNVVTRIASLCRSDIIGLADLPPEIATFRSDCIGSEQTKKTPVLSKLKNEKERDIILEALQHNNWNMMKTAQALGISRASLYKKAERFAIKRFSSPQAS